MTKKGPDQKLPVRRANGFKGITGTTGTSDMSQSSKNGHGTGGLQVSGLNYEDLPTKTKEENSSTSWGSPDRWMGIIGTVGVAIAACIYVFQMGSNISDIKSDQKEEKEKMNKIDEKISKQSADIQLINNSLQRIETDVRRTQDYVQQKPQK